MPRSLFEGVNGSPVGLIQQSSIITSADGSRLSQLDPVVLASYNLLPTVNGIETIVVPGSPSVWSPPQLPVQLERDRAQPVISEAFPACPLEPLFRALSITAPDVDLSTYDIVTDRRNLRLLFDFASGRPYEFRFNAEMVDNSVLLSRWVDWESRVHTKGYGKTFEQSFTKNPECATGSLVHKRAVGYTLGGLRMMVKFEVDACLEAPMELSQKEKDASEVVFPTGHKMKVRGVMAKAEEVVELKTKGRTGLSSSALPQMWFSRTPIICEGIHSGGNFGKVVFTNLEETGRLEQWEERNRMNIAKMVEALKLLRKAMVDVGGGRFAVICKNGALQICRLRLDCQFRLPQDIRAKWEEQHKERMLLVSAEKLTL